ncbi:MAG: TonB-dependent receptor [Muribaculaceae bacterium]|nr:TonB-dependent receptor [Muribaculaceae bacterium]
MLKRFYFSALMMLLAGAISLNAQITTSSISGVILDEANDPLIGAVVKLVHEPSGTEYNTVSNLDGRFYLQGMRTGGPYTATVTYVGYQNTVVNGIILELGENYNLQEIQMSTDANQLQEVVVTASGSKFPIDKTGASTNITNVQITNLPTVTRSITDVTRLSPYGGNGMSFAGTDGRTANFTVDGANFNNNFGLSDKLPGGGNPISLDAIEEMQVVISPYDVRQTNFIGGGVNAITKSGNNTLKGSAYIYHRNEQMRGDAVDGQQIAGAREKDRNTLYGFTLGGPIIKNQLFFFVNGEMAKIPTVANRWRASENGVADPDNYLSRTTVADLARVQKHVMDKYGYDTGSFTDFPADESNYKLLARIDWNINSDHHLALRYNYTKNNIWNSTNASSMDGGTRSSYNRASQYSMIFANAMYSMQNIVHSLSFDLNSRLTDKLSNQFLATWSKLDDVRGSNSSEFPFIDILDGTGNTGNYMALGYELFTWNNAVHNTIWNIKDDITYYAGNHKITAGINFEHQMADNQYMRNGSGYYRYLSVDDFINGAAPEVVCLTYGYDGESAPAARVQFNKAGIYGQDEWNVTPRFKLTYGLRIDGLFFNNKDLMTNGVRVGDIYDANGNPLTLYNKNGVEVPSNSGAYPLYNADGEPVRSGILGLDYYDNDGKLRIIDTGKWPKNSITFSPRVGFIWDVMGNKTLKVRGGTGLFSGRLPLVFFTNMPTNGGMVQYQAQLNAKNTDMTLFEGGLVTDANGKATIAALQNKLFEMGYPTTVNPKDGAVPSSISAVDPNFKMPQVWKSSIAIDYAIPVSFPFELTGEFIFNKTINAVSISDWSIPSVGGFARFNGVDNRPIYPDGFRTGTKAFVLENTSKGYGWSANLMATAKPADWVSLMASYTHTVAKEVTGMPGSAAESAFTYVPTWEGPNNIRLHNSQYVTPDRFIANATLHDHAGNHYSIIYETWRGGYNYSYMTSNDMNGDGYNYDAIYIPTDEEVASREFRFVSDNDRDRFMDYLHKDSYLKNHQGQYAEGYSVYSPWVHRIDLGYKHDFTFRAGQTKHTIQLSFDMKNVLNFFNSSWGVSKYLNPEIGSDARILKYEGVDADGFATFSTNKAISGETKTWVPNHSIGQCWNVAIGVQYIFN